MKISSNNFNELDTQAVNNIKALSIDMINEAKSGHLGIALSAAPIIYTLYANHLVFDNKNDKWINRDRFVMSAGHGSALLYSTLFMSGFDLSLEDLSKFRKYGSKTPGHPELNKTPGVDISTGSLGEGFGQAVGIAIAEKFLNNRYSYGKNKSLIDHYTYCLCSDGDIMEGVTAEAASVAGNLNLGKLIVLYDSNNMTLDGSTKETMKENVLAKFKAMNWDTQLVSNGNDLSMIDAAINHAKKKLDKPSIIEIKTVLGDGSLYANTNKAHGFLPGEEDIKQLKEKLNIRDIPFTVIGDAIKNMQERQRERNEKIIDKYNSLYTFKNKKTAQYKEEFEYLVEHNSFNLDKNVSLEIEEVVNKSGREIGGLFVNKLAENNTFLTITTDVSSSTKIVINNEKLFTDVSLQNRNIAVGVREHAASSIANGIASSGIKVFISTFLSFSDYLKPGLRMSAMMNLPVTYVFTNDSVLIGEDGPTHQPIEQLVSLRATPNITVYRPNDANEIVGSFKNALEETNPNAIVLSKEKTYTKEETSINNIKKGAYIVKDYKIIDGLIIATGSELDIALEVAKKQEEKGIKLRVVSMPSMELFEMQSDKYKNEIIPKNVKRVIIECSSSYSWYRYCNNENLMFNINEFGMSAPKEEIIDKLNLSAEKISEKISENL